MNRLDKIAIWWERLFRRSRLSLRDTRDNKEVWYTHISPMNITMAVVAVATLFFIIILTITSYTSLLNLMPGYSSQASRSRQLLVENIVKIDSMERMIDQMMLYADNVSLVMAGKKPVPMVQNTSSYQSQSKQIIKPNVADISLRGEMEGEGRYNLRAASALTTTPLVAPVEGVITRRFNISEERLGVRIATSAEQRVMAVQDGVVSLVLWSPEVGYTIQILHRNNLLSIYQNVPLTPLKRGDAVKAGSVIGYSGGAKGAKGTKGTKGVAEQQSSSDVVFELWRDGEPIDPEIYIIF